MRYILMLGLALLVLIACTSTETVGSEKREVGMTKELIVLATPPNDDKYYADALDDIFDFHITYAKEILKHDDVIILAGEDFYSEYVAELGADHVAPIEMQDIWMRDFSTLNAAAPVMMRYSAEGQGGGRKGQSDADAVQEVLAVVSEAASLSFGESELLNDGGNFVDDYAGNVVLSRKFLRDNELTETEGREAVRKATGAKNVAFIEADEQGGLEHADGVVAFVAENVLVINSYPEDPPYAANLISDLKRGLPGVTIHEIVTPYDGSQIYDSRFGSACGLYTNMLVTPKRIYFPQFGILEDKQALTDVRQWTDREVVPVMSNQVCKMGGGVRCMSWQLRGSEAEKFSKYVRSK